MAHLQELREGMRLDELHILGVARFGTDWLRANEIVIAGARAIGMEPGDFGITAKVMMSAIAFAVCDALLLGDDAPTGAASGGEGSRR